MRRRTSRRRSRKTSGGEQLVLVVGGLILAWMLLMGVVRFVAAHPWVPVVLVLLVGGAVAAWTVQRRRAARWERVRSQGLRYALAQLDTLHHRQFEHAVRDLMRRDGCADAVQVGGAGDNGADVKATDPYGRRWVIQCKHRKAGLAGSAVGTPDLQVLNGTGRPVHKGDVVVLVPNGRVCGEGGGPWRRAGSAAPRSGAARHMAFFRPAPRARTPNGPHRHPVRAVHPPKSPPEGGEYGRLCISRAVPCARSPHAPESTTHTQPSD
ncbi:restriction endonuclease [Streptomyces sp. NPDC093795]|uniref:restriction endonuclease n=1 Tax=Streptomyces sp. NPDC093795 TaxID=3366051 RepID=UPI003816587F